MQFISTPFTFPCKGNGIPLVLSGELGETQGNTVSEHTLRSQQVPQLWKEVFNPRDVTCHSHLVSCWDCGSHSKHDNLYPKTDSAQRKEELLQQPKWCQDCPEGSHKFFVMIISIAQQCPLWEYTESHSDFIYTTKSQRSKLSVQHKLG